MPSKRSGDSGAVLLSNAVSPGLCGEACACCTRPSSATQTLEELEFLRSAGAAAHQGDVVKLASILDKHPAAVHEDGTSGDFLPFFFSLLVLADRPVHHIDFRWYDYVS